MDATMMKFLSSSDSLFLNINPEEPENLTTEVFKYIFTSEEYSDCQKFIYNKIFGKGKNKDLDTKDWSFSVKTQHKFGESRPDCLIENKDTIIVIENKFFAPFTKNDQGYDDQIVNYYKELQKYSKKEKYLVLLTLKDRQKHYEDDIREQFETQGEPLAKSLDQISFTDPSITYESILWEELLKNCPSDGIIRNLGSFIAKKYIKNTILNKEELKMINTDIIPLLLEKLWNGVKVVKNKLESEGIAKPTEWKSGIEFYGFDMQEPFGNVWFGYRVEAWLTTKTPYILHIREEWINKELFSEKKMLEAGFKKHDQLEYIYPIKIGEGDIADSSVIDIVDCSVKKIDEAIKKLRKVMA